MRDRLNADLQREFGVSLSGMYEGRVNVLDVADFAAHLPYGGAVYEWYGGWPAVGSVEQRLQQVAHLLEAQIMQAAGKKKGPSQPEPPRSLRDAKVRAEKARSNVSRVRSAVLQGWR